MFEWVCDAAAGSTVRSCNCFAAAYPVLARRQGLKIKAKLTVIYNSLATIGYSQ